MNKENLLELKSKLESLIQKQKTTKKRIDELERTDMIKEYLYLIKEYEDINTEIPKYSKKYDRTKIGRCKHNTFIYTGDSIIDYNSDNFLCFNFKCKDCKFEKDFITGIWNNKIPLFDESDIINFINEHEIITELSESKEEFMEYIKKYINYATFDSIDKAHNFTNRRKIKKHVY